MIGEGKQINISIGTGTIVKAVLVLVAFYALYLVRDTVLILLTALVIASAVEPFVRWMTKIKIPRVLAALAVYAFAGLIIFGISLLFIPPMISEISRLSEVLPAYLASLNITEIIPGGISESPLVGDQIVNSISISEGLDKIQQALSGLSQGIFSTAARVFGGALSATLILVLSFYFAVQEEGIKKFLRVVSPLKNEEYIIDLWRRTQEKIGLWLQGQILLGVIIGVLVYLGLSVLRVPYATSLAALAALFELIPIFGPIIAAIPAVLVGFTQSVPLGLMIIGLFFIIQQFENQLIYPLVVTKIVGIPSLIVILALLVGGTLAGFLGFLLAIPIAVVFVELFLDLEKEKISLQKKQLTHRQNSGQANDN